MKNVIYLILCIFVISCRSVDVKDEFPPVFSGDGFDQLYNYTSPDVDIYCEDNKGISKIKMTPTRISTLPSPPWMKPLTEETYNFGYKNINNYRLSIDTSYLCGSYHLQFLASDAENNSSSFEKDVKILYGYYGSEFELNTFKIDFNGSSTINHNFNFTLTSLDQDLKNKLIPVYAVRYTLTYNGQTLLTELNTNILKTYYNYSKNITLNKSNFVNNTSAQLVVELVDYYGNEHVLSKNVSIVF